MLLLLWSVLVFLYFVILGRHGLTGAVDKNTASCFKDGGGKSEIRKIQLLSKRECVQTNCTNFEMEPERPHPLAPLLI